MPATSLRAHSTPTSLPRSARPHVRLLRGWPSRTSPIQARTVTAPSPCLHTHGRASFREFHTCCDRKVRLPTLRGEVFWACVPNYYTRCARLKRRDRRTASRVATSFMRVGGMRVARRPQWVVLHANSGRQTPSRSCTAGSLSMDGADGQGHRRRWHALQQCLELCWSLCNLTASHRWLHAGSMHHLTSTASSWAASTPAADHEAVLHACVPRVLCGIAVACVGMQVFYKTSHSPHFTTLLVDAVNYYEPRGRSY